MTTTTDHACCRCGGEGTEGHPEALWGEADALDTCYHCCGAGVCACTEPTPEELAAYLADERRARQWQATYPGEWMED